MHVEANNALDVEANDANKHLIVVTKLLGSMGPFYAPHHLYVYLLNSSSSIICS